MFSLAFYSIRSTMTASRLYALEFHHNFKVRPRSD